jgi:hypothetical protein
MRSLALSNKTMGIDAGRADGGLLHIKLKWTGFRASADERLSIGLQPKHDAIRKVEAHPHSSMHARIIITHSLTHTHTHTLTQTQTLWHPHALANRADGVQLLCQLDPQASGWVERHAATLGLRRMGQPLLPSELDALMASFETDGHARIPVKPLAKVLGQMWPEALAASLITGLHAEFANQVRMDFASGAACASRVGEAARRLPCWGGAIAATEGCEHT